jgi:hypothetical protein
MRARCWSSTKSTLRSPDSDLETKDWGRESSRGRGTLWRPVQVAVKRYRKVQRSARHVGHRRQLAEMRRAGHPTSVQSVLPPPPPTSTGQPVSIAGGQEGKKRLSFPQKLPLNCDGSWAIRSAQQCQGGCRCERKCHILKALITQRSVVQIHPPQPNLTSTKTITWRGSRQAQGPSAYCLFAPVGGKLRRRGNLIE